MQRERQRAFVTAGRFANDVDRSERSQLDKERGVTLGGIGGGP